METLILTIHLILALLLIGVVLVQKSEGSALLSGGGNTQARARPNGFTRLTWVLAIAFIITSLALTIVATRGTGSGSVVDGMMPPASSDSAAPPVSGMMPPPAGSSADPAAPPAADPAAPPAETAPAEPAPETAPEAPEAAPDSAVEANPAEPAN